MRRFDGCVLSWWWQLTQVGQRRRDQWAAAGLGWMLTAWLDSAVDVGVGGAI
jgi:hypothetical protein